jgi:hypothetical protein
LTLHRRALCQKLLVKLKLISPTFYEQLFLRFSCAKKEYKAKLQVQRAASISFVQKAASISFVQKAAHNMLVKLTHLVLSNMLQRNAKPTMIN